MLGPRSLTAPAFTDSRDQRDQGVEGNYDRLDPAHGTPETQLESFGPAYGSVYRLQPPNTASSGLPLTITISSGSVHGLLFFIVHALLHGFPRTTIQWTKG